MRISKEPEVRKQEIIDAAMKVFAEKGYEAATMKDIAKTANVVAGLCYHYFCSKEALYQEAVKQYARECSQDFIAVFEQTQLSLDECLDLLEKILISQKPTYKYQEFFDQEGNELFHKQLELYMSKEIFPYMQNFLGALVDRGEIPWSNTYLLAHFIWGGQLTVINEETIPIEERILFIRDMIKRMIK